MREAIDVGGSRVELVHGDSFACMGDMAAGSVDVTATSPPYNLGIEYGHEGWDDSMPRSEFLSKISRWLDLAWRVLSPEGSLFLNMGSKPTNPLGPEQVLMAAADPGRLVGIDRKEPPFVLQNKIAWVKSVSVRVRFSKQTVQRAASKAELTVGQARRLIRAMRELEGPDGEARSVGHIKPLTSDRFVADAWEVVYHLTKTGSVKVDRRVPGLGVPYEDKTNIARWKEARSGGDLRCRGNVWVVPYETINDRDADRPHPASFPPRLVELCYLLHGKSRIRSTLDPFSGIGSSAIAAARLGLPHVGIELGRHNHDEAVRRIRAMALETAWSK